MRSRSLRRRALAAERGQSARDADLIGAREAVQAQKRSREMERRRQAAAPQHGKLAARLDEVELAKELDAVADAEALVEIEQVYAAAQENVLAIIDDLGWLVASGGSAVRCRAAP